MAPGGVMEDPVNVAVAAIHYEEAPIPPAQRVVGTVNWEPAMCGVEIPDSELDKLKSGHLWNVRSVESALAPKLNLQSPRNYRVLTNSLDARAGFVDNTAIYTKLLWYALVRDLYDVAGVAPVAAPWPANVPIAFQNLDADVYDPTITNTYIEQGRFIFVQDVDIAARDILLLRWLACGGMRFQPADSVAVPHAAYITFNEIQCVLLSHGAPPSPRSCRTYFSGSDGLCSAAGQQQAGVPLPIEGCILGYGAFRHNVCSSSPTGRCVQNPHAHLLVCRSHLTYAFRLQLPVQDVGGRQPGWERWGGRGGCFL